MATASDDFNRADAANLGANWAQAKGHSDRIGIFSNACDVPAGTERFGDYYSGTAFTADQFSQATVVALASHTQAVTVRSITSGITRNLYYGGFAIGDFGDAKYRIWKDVANVQTSLIAHATDVVQVGDVLKLEIIGTTLNLYGNGSLKVTITDGSLSAGQPGMRIDHNAINVAIFDDWSGGDVSAGGGPLTWIPVGTTGVSRKISVVSSG